MVMRTKHKAAEGCQRNRIHLLSRLAVDDSVLWMTNTTTLHHSYEVFREMSSSDRAEVPKLGLVTALVHLIDVIQDYLPREHVAYVRITR